MADRYHDMRVGHFCALPGRWRPHRAWHRYMPTGFWPCDGTGFYGLLSGLAVYGLVQARRGCWKLCRDAPTVLSKEQPKSHGKQTGISNLNTGGHSFICIELFYVRPPA